MGPEHLQQHVWSVGTSITALLLTDGKEHPSTICTFKSINEIIVEIYL